MSPKSRLSDPARLPQLRDALRPVDRRHLQTVHSFFGSLASRTEEARLLPGVPQCSGWEADSPWHRGFHVHVLLGEQSDDEQRISKAIRDLRVALRFLERGPPGIEMPMARSRAHLQDFLTRCDDIIFGARASAGGQVHTGPDGKLQMIFKL